jgi:hypothetical protein
VLGKDVSLTHRPGVGTEWCGTKRTGGTIFARRFLFRQLAELILQILSPSRVPRLSSVPVYRLPFAPPPKCFYAFEIGPVPKPAHIDLTTEIIPAEGDLPAVCFAGPNPGATYRPLDIALFSCITGQDRSADNRQGGECESVPLSSLVRAGYVAALRFERFLLIRLPRLEAVAGSLSRRFRIFLERAFAVSFHYATSKHR